MVEDVPMVALMPAQDTLDTDALLTEDDIR